MSKGWVVVGYHNATGYRSELPIRWPTRGKAEEVCAVTKRVIAPGFQVVVEEVEEDDEP